VLRPKEVPLGYNFYMITTYRMYAEIIEKLHASNMKLFTYPSRFEVFTNLSILKVSDIFTIDIKRSSTHPGGAGYEM
jgi:hypothetical protein